jgi:hypothetical protein
VVLSHEWRNTPHDYTALTTKIFVGFEQLGSPCIYLDLVLFRPKSPATKRQWEAGWRKSRSEFEQEAGAPEVPCWIAAIWRA